MPVGTYTVKEIRDGIEIENYNLNVTGEGETIVTDGETTEVEVVNRYVETVPFTPEVKKQITDTNGNNVDDWDFESKPFQFTISSEDDDTPLPEPVTVETDATGVAKWSEIRLERGKTYHYIVQEVKPEPALDDVNYDTGEHKLTVSVDSDGTVTKTWDDTSTTPTITNIYAPKISLTLSLQKKYVEKETDGELPIEQGQFSFTIAPADTNPEAPMPSNPIAETDENGKVEWEEFVFEKSGEWDYIVSENDPQDPSVIWDKTEYQVHVSVTRNDDHTLSASWTWNGDETSPTITNYHYEPVHLPITGADGFQNWVRMGAIVSTTAFVTWFVYKKRQLRHQANI